MKTCEYSQDSALKRTFRGLLVVDGPTVIRALHAAIIFECPDAFAPDLVGYGHRTWVTSLDEGGVAIIRLKSWAVLDELSLTVEVQSRHSEDAEALFDRLVSRAGLIAAAEISEAEGRPSLVALPGGSVDDLPF